MELVEILDNKRRPLNKVKERYDDTKGEYRQVVHSWIRNSKGEFLIQQRSMNKKIFPGAWSVTGGGVDVGETTLDSVIRETKEEVGIEIKEDEVELMLTLKKGYCFVDVYMTTKDVELEDLELQKEEVSQVKWATKKEISDMIEKGEIPSTVRLYFSLLCSLIEENN